MRKSLLIILTLGAFSLGAFDAEAQRTGIGNPIPLTPPAMADGVKIDDADCAVCRQCLLFSCSMNVDIAFLKQTILVVTV